MKKQVFDLSPGSRITGKWNGRTYTTIKKLGAGACGTVFLCRSEQGDTYALKVGEDSSRMMLEVNMLKKFSKVQGVKLGPSFVDVDDWINPSGRSFPFYVMEYVDGTPLPEFLKGKTKDWVGIFAIQLLTDLENLHHAGYVFGDLKTENLLISSSRVRWIDVGGVTAIGRAIKEYTEFYDRGYWNLGSRKAEATYDLFAVTMIMMEMGYPKRFDKGSHPHKTLESKLASSSVLKPYRRIIQQCWKGKIQNSADMKRALSDILMKRSGTNSSRVQKRRSAKESENRELATLTLTAGVVFGVSVLSFFL
ncbi:protein kinase domain-containing protein [Halobacillus karajensis]|uniref:Serine/threonine-protein kinase 1 n=1 Tax=Halobacillus karajensis TaxID=195088 RepID=A0A024PA34_9BACI|nr:serine/threonine-protein kinase [Halobacillus karajensis]CDQ21794.1 serine/threonine-protein kinase 1 [Halobacillus karajensis]CDQ25790.1 serine/threonine-protein kinase 1 [Halobacillus karajensis]CDQ29791.1 serine/threonine-protein kinase 1 [Halobacillus karajensis]